MTSQASSKISGQAGTAVVACVLAGTALAQPHHEEVQVGVDASGQLHMHTHAPMPFVLPVSPFPGIDGYAHAEVALASLPSDHPQVGLFLLPQTVDIRAVLVSHSPGMHVYGGLDPLPVGGELVLGAPVIHYLPIWNISSTTPGEVKDISFFFRDASGQFMNSEVFTITFTAVPAPSGALALAGLGVLAARRRR